MKEYIIAFECPVTESSERTAYQVQQKLVGELIRCKDCKYFTRYKDCIEMYMWDGECSEWVSHTYLDWFCSRAERKEE